MTPLNWHCPFCMYRYRYNQIVAAGQLCKAAKTGQIYGKENLKPGSSFLEQNLIMHEYNRMLVYNAIYTTLRCEMRVLQLKDTILAWISAYVRNDDI